MIDADRFIRAIAARRAGLFTGVPCSFLSPVIDRAIHDPAIRYISATSEGESVAHAVGAWLAGTRALVGCQNSGLGNMVNPISSLAFPYRVPFLLLCSWRGRPGIGDEPQHELMGQAMPTLLDLLQVEWKTFPADEGDLGAALDAADASMEQRCLPYCLLMSQDSVRPRELDETVATPRSPGKLVQLGSARRLTRIAALEHVLSVVDDETAIVSSTGKTSRELFTLADRPQHFYQVGSMGCASAVALGVALCTSRRVLVLDGDGAALMKLGNLATIGTQAPPNLVHVVLHNGVHDSTGAQRTAAPAIDFAQLAVACGYRRAVACDALDDFDAALRSGLAGDGPQLVQLTIQPGSIADLGRPTVQPSDVARRFRAFMIDTAPCAAPRVPAESEGAVA